MLLITIQIAADYSSVTANADKLNALQIEIDNNALPVQRQRYLWTQGIGTRNEPGLVKSGCAI